MSESGVDCREVIYNLTELRAKEDTQLHRLRHLYEQKITHL